MDDGSASFLLLLGQQWKDSRHYPLLLLLLLLPVKTCAARQRFRQMSPSSALSLPSRFSAAASIGKNEFSAARAAEKDSALPKYPLQEADNRSHSPFSCAQRLQGLQYTSQRVSSPVAGEGSGTVAVKAVSISRTVHQPIEEVDDVHGSLPAAAATAAG